MKKIPTLFERDWDGDRSLVTPTPNEACDWVFAGEGWPTRKMDGTCAMIKDSVLYKRREIKKGKPVPPGFTLADEDETTGKKVGWLQVEPAAPEDKYFAEAIAGIGSVWRDGTYELVGPKVQGNHENVSRHFLVPHNSDMLLFEEPVPRDFNGLKTWLASHDIEGVVFHHPDGRMAKIKLRDFGLKRPKHL